MIAGLALLATLASASEPCAQTPDPPPPHLSVAWISPLGRHTRANKLVDVVSTRALTTWASEHPKATPGDLLRLVDQRDKKKEPRRRYKVVIFEVASNALCRPIQEMEEGQVFAGLPACPGGSKSRGQHYPLCGYTTDRNTNHAGPEVFQARWKDLAARGFCVLPIERFLAEGGR